MKNSVRKNKFILLSLLTTLIAVGVHIYLTQHYYGLKYGTLEGPSMCNVNEVLNCDAVSASKFSSFLGIPMAMWGVFTNIILLYFLAVTHLNLVQDRAKTSRYALMFSGITVAASLIMGSISLILMHNLCLFCIVTYVLSFLGFFGAWMGAESATCKNLTEDFKDIFSSEKWVAGFLIAIPALSFLGNLMYLESHGFAEIDKIANEKVAYWQVAAVQNFDPATGLSYQNGTTEPRLTVVEFADFRCPHCKQAAPTLHAFAKSHSDVKLIFKPFPLDGTCNEAIRGGGDGISCGLAAAVICAEKLSQKGWATHDYFFENQMDIIRIQNLDKNLEAVSSAVSLNAEELKTCVKDPGTLETIRKMAKEGEVAQIQGTPTVFLNGKLLSGGQLLPILEAAYRSLK